MIALLLAQAHAFDSTICVDIATDYTDLGGDFWPTNANRPARGINYRVSQFQEPDILGNANSQGCFTVDVDANKSMTVTISSAGTHKGEIFLSWSGTCYDATNVPLAHESTWYKFPPANAVVVVGPGDEWRNLALAQWAIHRNNHGLRTGSTRDCCLTDMIIGPDDGTCPWTNLHYTPITHPILLMAHPANAQFGDNIATCNGGQTRGLRMTSGTKSRTLIAHEYGHLVVSMRIGAPDQRFDLDAPLDDCMGDYQPNGTPADSDFDPGGRGEFTKETLSSALGEGYADFYSLWLWNSRQHSDCVFDMWTVHDLDLDCDPDDVWANDPGRNGQVNCADGFELGTANPSDPTNTFGGTLDGVNWLADIESAPDSRTTSPDDFCVGPGSGAVQRTCVNTPANDHDRATMMDVAKFYWQLTAVPNGQGVPPKEITDMLIDSCPTNWQTDGANSGDADHPYERLLDGAAAQGLTTEVLNAEHYFRQ